MINRKKERKKERKKKRGKKGSALSELIFVKRRSRRGRSSPTPGTFVVDKVNTCRHDRSGRSGRSAQGLIA